MKKAEKAKTFTVRRSALFILAALYLMVGFLGGVIFKELESQKYIEMRELMAEQSAKVQLTSLETKYSKLTTSMWKAVAHPNDARQWVELGLSYRINNKPNDAIRALNMALKAEPNHENARFIKGEIELKDLDNLKGAIVTWEDLLLLNPDARSPEGDKVEDILRRAKEKKK